MRTVGEGLGTFLRHISGAVAFGMWQHSILSGVFIFFLLVTLDKDTYIGDGNEKA